MLTPADHALFAFARSHDSVFSTADASASGLTEPQIRFRALHFWERLHDGVFRVPGSAPSWRGDLRAAIMAAGDGAAISHRSAAALYDLPSGRRDLIELTCRRWERSVRPGLVVHESRRLDSEDVQLVDGISTTTPELLLLHLAALRPFENYVEMMIHAARRKRLITYESTLRTFDRHARRGLKGTRAVRTALERWNPTQATTESEMETMLLQAIRSRGLPDPVLQFEVRDIRGALIGRVDAAYPTSLLAIEYDSMQEHSDEFQLARDARRRNRLAAMGYLTLSARHADLRSGGAQLCEQIDAITRRRAATDRTGVDTSA
jgi:very-short-patch-repair endonuclease